MAISSALGSSALLPAGLGFRNVLINGDFKVWQRGTSTAFTASASTSFLADRWSGYRGVAGSTQSRVSSGLSGFQYALRMQRDSGNTSTSRIYIGQSFETSTIATFAGKRMALSFYARAGSNFSAASSLFRVMVFSGTGTECNVIHVTPTSVTTDLDTTFTLTTSWQLFTAYYNVPSGVTQHGIQLDFTPVGTASTNDYVDITGVQLEQNRQPTPFEQRPIGVELALCQRYYWKTYPQSDAPGTNYTGTAITSTNSVIHLIGLDERWSGFLVTPVTMRTAPSIAVYSVSGQVGYNSYAGGQGSTTYTNATCTTYSAYAGISYTMTETGAGTGWYAAAHFVASAEL
jgi:hypothetical protein